ncbi:MAG: hypothetical protein EOM07_11200, partial [Clostridia bacterium]|nr:hypothetical protein [Clostridia bacterium]
MNTLQLYKNSKPYPYYSSSLTAYGSAKSVTPVNQNLRSGYVDLQLTLDDLLEFNYLSYSRNGRTVYAWVTDVEKLGGSLLYRVNFEVDAFRTYRSDLVLGNQFIVRRPVPSASYDPYLSSDQDWNDISINVVAIGNPLKRYAVVQKKHPGAAEIVSRVPGQPTPYQFWVCEYDVNNWSATTALRQLIQGLGDSAESSDIVTIYSVPHVDSSYLTGGTLNYKVGTTNKSVDGWSLIRQETNPFEKFQNKVPLIFNTQHPDLTKVKHSVSLVIPDAGILNVPDEVIYGPNPVLIREVDIFSGSCNYHLAMENGLKMTPYSVRGSALSTIPILSNPYDTYISQNQNTIAASLLGDTASLIAGGVMMSSGNPLGGAMAMQGGKGMLDTMIGLSDAKNMIPSNPPAFLGSALVG